MKRIIICFFIVLIIFFVAYKSGDVEAKDELRGIFISYLEEKRYLKEDQDRAKEKILSMIDNIKRDKFNLVILQVRSFSDSIYPSEIYPYSSIFSGIEGEEYFDVLRFFLDECHKYNIKVYAWINPYRIRGDNDIYSISSSNPAYKYIGTDTIYVDNGIYYNPSKVDVENLVVDGVVEIIDNYDVDGILFDDYFYPSDTIDLLDYNMYIQNNGYMSSSDYHLMVINRLIKRVHDECKEREVLFGVSPDGNINNNYNYLYADIYTWLDKKYVDFIMPQVYYGFFNETMPFYETVSKWDSYIKNDIDLIIALAMYKCGNVDDYAKSGSKEWIKYNNIIQREVVVSRNLKNYSGFSLFRYDFYFNEEYYNDNSVEEVNNLQKILK